jgi:mono/diheme cytochrome c family protein
MERIVSVLGGIMAAASLSLAIGCGGAQTGSGDPGGGSAQTATGAKLFASRCSGCHGPSGQGGPGGPALVGKAALPVESAGRKVPLKNADDLFKFTKSTMPPNKAGSLTDEQYYAVVAFVLKSNGVAVDDKQVDAASAPSLPIH